MVRRHETSLKLARTRSGTLVIERRISSRHLRAVTLSPPVDVSGFGTLLRPRAPYHAQKQPRGSAYAYDEHGDQRDFEGRTLLREGFRDADHKFASVFEREPHLIAQEKEERIEEAALASLDNEHKL